MEARVETGFDCADASVMFLDTIPLQSQCVEGGLSDHKVIYFRVPKFRRQWRKVLLVIWVWRNIRRRY
jgi:hypothetical protein